MPILKRDKNLRNSNKLNIQQSKRFIKRAEKAGHKAIAAINMLKSSGKLSTGLYNRLVNEYTEKH